MRRSLLACIAIAVALSAAIGVYRFAVGAWPGQRSIAAYVIGERSVAADTTSAAEKSVLYWKHPDGDPDFSATPKKTSDGRDYLPVFDEEEEGFKGSKGKQAKAKNGNSKILYYRNPMGLPDTSPVPKKDWMGMDYIAVYEGEQGEEGSSIRVSLDKVQRSGVRTELVAMQRIARPVRAPAVAKPDERTLHSVTLRADSFVEELYVNETGKVISAGDRLFRFYSPQVVSAQIDYRTTISNPGIAPQRGQPGGLQRLKNLGLPESVLDEIQVSSTPLMTIDWPSPVSGVVMEKKAIAGQMVRAGEELYRLGDLTNIWVIADVSEQDMGVIRVGTSAKISFRAFPNEPFTGRVAFVLHELDARSRTGKVRLEVKNPELQIKLEMYADVEIETEAANWERLAVPVSAVIDSGNRQVVIVERGEGLFEPRAVRLGVRGEGLIEIVEGVKAGERVVVTANFLIDAESNLRAALRGFTADAATGSSAAEKKQ